MYLFYIERLNHSLYGSVDARERKRARISKHHTPTNHTEKLHPKHASIHTNIYILDMFLKYNWKNLSSHWFLKLYVKKHAFLESEFIRKKHAFS